MLFNGSLAYILYCGRVFMQEAYIPCYTPPKQISLGTFLYGMQVHSSFSPCRERLRILISVCGEMQIGHPFDLRQLPRHKEVEFSADALQPRMTESQC